MYESEGAKSIAADHDVSVHTVYSVKRTWDMKKEKRAGEENPEEKRTRETVPIRKTEEDVQLDARMERLALEEALDEAEFDRRTKRHLQELFEVAVTEAIKTIKQGPLRKGQQASWLTAVNRTLQEGITSYQLLMGKATDRIEQTGSVNHEHEHSVIHRLQQYEDVYKRLAEAGQVYGVDESDDTGEPVDTDRADGQAG